MHAKITVLVLSILHFQWRVSAEPGVESVSTKVQSLYLYGFGVSKTLEKELRTAIAKGFHIPPVDEDIAPIFQQLSLLTAVFLDAVENQVEFRKKSYIKTASQSSYSYDGMVGTIDVGIRLIWVQGAGRSNAVQLEK